MVHRNAKLGLAGRYALVRAIDEGLSLQAAAAAFSVSPATAHRWWHRWVDGGRSPATLVDRSSRPHRQPRRLTPAEEEPILRARRETNLGPGRLAGIVRRARSTIWKVLRRHGLSRRPRGQRQSCRRYEWSRPGALLHLDVKKLARFSVPGHRVTGDRSTKDLHRGIGYDHLHCIVDDHYRLAYVELHPPEAVMTDNAMVYRNSRHFRQLLADRQIRHIRTPAYTPRWNGKAERFIRTLQDEWAYAHTWPDSHARARSLLSFLRYYNRRRPHSSLGDRPPISRVHNVCGQDN